MRGGRTELLPKRGIWEAEVAEPATQAAVRSDAITKVLSPTQTSHLTATLT